MTSEPPRDNPVTDHQQDYCEHEMSSCAGGCPPYGYCTSSSHKGDMAPNWPCPSVLRALGETKKEWMAKHDAELDAWIEWSNAEFDKIFKVSTPVMVVGPPKMKSKFNRVMRRVAVYLGFVEDDDNDLWSHDVVDR